METKSNAIQWQTSYDDGFTQAREYKKPLYLDFFKNGWAGCAKMDAVTYPDATVAAALNDLFVPVRVNIEEASKLAFQYGAIWTPNINIIETKEHAVYRVEGWLAPSEFVAMLYLAKGHYLFSGKKFEEAAATFTMVAENYTRSDFAPEALYYIGVSRYLATSDVEEIKTAWGKLQRQHPQSTWTMRADILG